MKRLIIPIFRIITLPLFLVLVLIAIITACIIWLWEFKYDDSFKTLVKDLTSIKPKDIIDYCINRD